MDTIVFGERWNHNEQFAVWCEGKRKVSLVGDVFRTPLELEVKIDVQKLRPTSPPSPHYGFGGGNWLE